ncbi:MAG: flagellar biosynthetic protein FliR, partial [Acidobacteriota bacterium]|nr:flagellar biosynthetic protein FliR [Acidobacteriota bacterium]
MEIQLPVAEVIRFVVVLTRLGGVMISAPFLSGNAAPIPVRIVFSLAVAFVLTPLLPLGSLPAELSLSSLTGLLLLEVVFGLVLGFVANCIFAGLQLAGQIMSFQMG